MNPRRILRRLAELWPLMRKSRHRAILRELSPLNQVEVEYQKYLAEREVQGAPQEAR